jgi:hypothetical protein
VLIHVSPLYEVGLAVISEQPNVALLLRHFRTQWRGDHRLDLAAVALLDEGLFGGLKQIGHRVLLAVVGARRSGRPVYSFSIVVVASFLKPASCKRRLAAASERPVHLWVLP